MTLRNAVVAGGFTIALVSALALLVAGPGYRVDLWGLRTAFSLMRWAAYGGIIAVLVAAAGVAVAVPRGGRALLLGGLAIVIGGISVYIPWSWRQRARSVPPIHDITTDTETPPAFEAVLPLRVGAPNTAEYGGPEVAAQQRAAYPDIRPAELAAPPGELFHRALAAAREMGWEIVAADSVARRIEATATTRWFGFKDDVAVRVTASDGGSRVDVRSVSRVGRSDIGTNARRIRQYLSRLTSR